MQLPNHMHEYKKNWKLGDSINLAEEVERIEHDDEQRDRPEQDSLVESIFQANDD